MTLRVLWVLLTVAAVVVLARVVVRTLRPSREAGRLLLPAAILLLMVSWPVQSNFKFGQLSIFLGLVVVADLLVLDRHRAQGVLTGLAAALKLTPLIFLPYLWITGRKRAACSAAGAFATATGLAFVALPHESVVFWTKRIFEATRMESVAWNPNQSLYGALLRTNWPSGVVRPLWAALSVLVVCVGLRRARRARAAGQPLLSVAIVGATSLVASPITWAHHQIWLVLAVFGTFTADGRANRWIRALMVVTIAQGVILLPVHGGLVRWWVVNNRLVLSIVVACFLPFVAAGGRSGPEREEASFPAVEGDGEAERLREPRARQGVLEGT